MHSSLVSVLLFAAAVFAAPLDTANESSSDNSNASGDCKPIIMIYARGTWEPGSPPNQVAAPLIKALDAKYPGQVDARIVEYSGGATGYLTGGDVAGTTLMEKMTKDAVSKCPDSKLLMIGYSQGSQVLHKAVSNLPSNVASHIKAVVVFGDPNKGQAIKGISNSIILTECFANDNVCNGLPLPVGAHNEYYKRIDEATDWIVKTLGKV